MKATLLSILCGLCAFAVQTMAADQPRAVDRDGLLLLRPVGSASKLPERLPHGGHRVGCGEELCRSVSTVRLVSCTTAPGKP